MAITRRKTLAIIGGGTILAATTAGAAFLGTRTPAIALAPWEQAGQYDEPRRRALSYAILAPNPHNRQPWLVDLSQPDQITLYVDTTRLLPHTDPFSRQITIGLGCFLELLRMAAAQDGYRVTIAGFPSGSDPEQLDQRPVAHIRFSKDQTVQPDPLFAHVLQRRSLKEPFDPDRAVPDDALTTLLASLADTTNAGATNQPQLVDTLRQLTRDALAIEIETPRTYKESVDLFRIGKVEINETPDGIDFSGPMFDSLAALGLFSRDAALDTGSTVYKQGIAAVMANVDSAMGYVWLTSQTNTRTDQLAAGRDWLRLNLAATGIGLGVHPLSQALQEYPEINELYEDIHQILGANGRTVQMLARLGYAADVPPSPRWPIDAKIM